MSINEYKSPYVTTDMVLFRIGTKESADNRKIDEHELQILMVKRDEDPRKGYLALPGGFVNIGEDILDNVKRKLAEKTGVSGTFYMEQLYTWGKVDRDPRARVISISYLGLCNSETYDDSEWKPVASWRNVEEVLKDKKVAFDHKEIITYAIDRIKNKIEYTDIAFNLLPTEFTMADCQIVYESFLGKKIQNFRRKINEYVSPLNKKQEGKAFRPAELFTVNKDRKSPFLK